MNLSDLPIPHPIFHAIVNEVRLASCMIALGFLVWGITSTWKGL